jgi:hypothetical protein
MLLKRCPSCRSLWDAERYSVCFGCGAALGDKAVPVSAPTPAPELLRTTRHDRATFSVVLILFAIIGGIGMLGFMGLSGIPFEFKFGLGLLLGVLLILAAWGNARGVDFGATGLILVRGLALVGILIGTAACLVFGLAVLFFAACALGVMR